VCRTEACLDSAAAAGPWNVLRNIGLLVRPRVIVGGAAAAVLEKGDAAQAGFGLAALVPLVAARGTLALHGMAVAVRLIRLLRLLAGLTGLLARAVAPALIVALPEAAHRLDDAEVMVRVLPVGLGLDAIARSGGLAGQGLVFVEHLMGVAADPHVGTAAVEDLVAIGRTIGVVMLLVVMVSATTAATITAAARPLPIVRSH